MARAEAFARPRLRPSVTTLVVLQPGYLPWLGYFEQLARADVFVVYDDVQYDKNGWRNRNRIRTPTPQGWSWLTVPVRREHLTAREIRDVHLDVSIDWRRQHWRTLLHHYGRARYWDRYAGDFEAIYARDWISLVDLDVALAGVLAAGFGIERRVLRSSQLGARGHKTERLAALALELGADRYYSGAAARDYLDVAAMEAAGVSVEFQDYQHPSYSQRYEPFVPYLSAIDLLLNEGPRSTAILLSGGRSGVA